MRSTAQLISYELVLSSAIFLVVLLTSSLNLTANTEAQKAIWLVIPLLPIFVIFIIAGTAETNRAPFDLAEAESELVSGFMTEHSSVVFVFFFLAEYANIILICIFTSILFVGGYLLNFNFFIVVNELFITLFDYISSFVYVMDTIIVTSLDLCIKSIISEDLISNPNIENLIYGLTLAIKSFFMIFVFIWVRASFPRIRFDQLMSYC